MGIFPPTICLIEINSIKSDELLGYKELAMRVRRDNERDVSISPPSNEYSANREHDLTQTCLEYNTQDNTVIVVQSINAMKGSWKRLREEKHNIPHTLPTVSSSPFER